MQNINLGGQHMPDSKLLSTEGTAGAQKPLALPAELQQALERTRLVLNDQNNRIVRLRRILFNIAANGQHDKRCDPLGGTCAPLCARRMAKEGLA